MAKYTRANSPEERSKYTQTEAEKNPLPWKVFYMSVAELESQRSNCDDTERVSAIRLNINLLYSFTGFKVSLISWLV